MVHGCFLKKKMRALIMFFSLEMEFAVLDIPLEKYCVLRTLNGLRQRGREKGKHPV